MPKRTLYLDEFTESIAAMTQYSNECIDINNDHQKLVKTLVNAIDGELTSRQRECIIRYFGENMKITDIANELNLSPSTVSRHIQKAKSRLKKIIGYYFHYLS